MNASTPEKWPSGAGVQRRTSSENSTTNPPSAITEAGANFAEIRPRSIVLMTIDTIAMPTEKIAMTRLATRSSAVRMFFTSGGKMMISTAPIVQKKLREQSERNSPGRRTLEQNIRPDAGKGTTWSAGGDRHGGGG